MADKNYAGWDLAWLPTCHVKVGEEEAWLELSLFWRQPTCDLPFAQVLPQALAVLGKLVVLRGWSSWRKEELGNPPCERANALFCFNLGNASYVVFYFPFFLRRAEEKLQIQAKNPKHLHSFHFHTYVMVWIFLLF